MINFGFYLSQFITQFTDTKRSDFWQMFIHHVVVLILHYFSWILNMIRIGSVILVIHDCADFMLDLAKALKYAKLQKACDVAFISFVVVWTITRLLIFPRILFMTVSETLSPDFCEKTYPVLYIFNILLFIILFLNIFWSCLIFKILANTLKKGHFEKDDRSSDDETDDNTKQID